MHADEIIQQFINVRACAEELVAQLGADPTSAAPFLEAVSALEQSMADKHDTTNNDCKVDVFVATAHHSPVQQNGDQGDLATALQRANAHIARLEQVLTATPIGICIRLGREQRYIFTNPTYDRLVGRSNVVGKTVRDVFPEIENQGINEVLDQVYTTGEPFIAPEIRVELDRSPRGLEEVYLDLTYQPLRDKGGTIIGVFDNVVDISNRRSLEHERVRVLELTQQTVQIAESERQRLLNVLLEAPAAICTLEGSEHVFTFTNPLYNQLVGHHDLIGKPVRVALPEVEGQGFFELLDNVYTTGVPFVGIEVPIELKSSESDDMQQRFLNFIYAPLRDADETVVGIFVHAIDVTELVAARQQAEAAVVVRDQFLSVAAHELKTPLTSLLGYIQVIQRRMQRAGNVDERTDQTLTLIRKQGQRLTRLIDTLLDVARINLGHLTLETAPLDLVALVARVVDELGITLDQRTIQLNLPTQECVVIGDSLRLEQVLVNLIQNAIKYSPIGGTVELRVWQTSTQACVSIRDEGIGIPAESLPLLFERFYRVNKGVARWISGMGIGLSVVKEIVTLHGGTVAVESTEGVGSTFTVYLPLVQPSDAIKSANQ